MTRVALVGGKRSPFTRAGTLLKKFSFLDLGIHVAEKTVEDLELSPSDLDEIAFSTVLLDPRFPNAARELVLRSSLPKSLSGHFVSNNCISGLVAVNLIRDGIACGRIQSGLAGGAESMSQPSLTLRRDAEKFFLNLSMARGFKNQLKAALKFKPGYLLPVPPSPKEPSTGLTMGQHCELTAKEFGIKREEQDEWALRSHKRAAAAKESGILDTEIAPIEGVDSDNFIRKETSQEKLASLRPVFDRTASGTLTAGNSSGLTDGSSLVCLMSEEKVKAEGREALAYIDAIEFAAIDPKDGLLMAPALALPRLLERQGLGVADIDIFEIHEAFSAQVIANRMAWAQGWSKYPKLKPFGDIPDEKINMNGGSIAIGHPFAATGGRLLLSAAGELKRSGKKWAVISICAAGAMAGAVLLSRD